MNLWHELRRRQMFRLVGLYIVGAWLVVQVADIVFPTWGVPDSAMRYLFLAALLCFPIALVFGWVFDVTWRGIFRTRKAGPDEIIETKLERADYAILVALLAVGLAVLVGSAGKVIDQVDDAPTAIERRENAIAVLPFDNLDENPETGYFSDGVTEEILTRLSSLGPLHVIGRTSSFAFRNSGEAPAQISAALGVSYMLQGSVRRDRDLVRVTARLVDQIGELVWTASYDRELENIFDIQSEIAQSVAGQIVREIAPQEIPSASRATTNLEAYDAYLVGRALFNARVPGWPWEAEKVLRKAIELDPDFAPPYALLSIALTFRLHPDFETERKEICRHAQRAIDLSPDLAEANLAISHCYGWNDQPQLEIESKRRAIELDPSFSIAHAWLANSLRSMNRFDEAIAIEIAALESDPLNPVLIVNVAMTHMRHRDVERAEQLLLRGVSTPAPANFAYGWLRDFYVTTGRLDEGLRWFQEEFRAHASVLSEHEAENVAWWVDNIGLLNLRLAMFDEAEEWHRLANTVHLDSFREFFYQSYKSHLRGQLGELRLLTRAFAQEPGLADHEHAEEVRTDLAITQIIAGQTDRGIEVLEPLITVEPFDPDKSTIWFPMMERMLYLAHALQEKGRSQEAAELVHRVLLETKSIDESDRWDVPETFATMALSHGLLGNHEASLQALGEAIELGWVDYYQVVNDPLWIKAFDGIDLRQHLASVKAKLERQRAAVEQANAEHDFRAELEQILREAGMLTPDRAPTTPAET